MSNEAYSRVIDLIDSGAVDYRAIAIGLAKECPEAFLALCDGATTMTRSPQGAMNKEVYKLVAQNKTVDAIKLVRSVTSLGLKESKDYVDDIKAGKAMPALPLGTVIKNPPGQRLINIDEKPAAGEVSLGELLRQKLSITSPTKYEDEGTF